MILSSRQNQFELYFPKTLVPKEIEDKYMPYLQRTPNCQFQNATDFVNYGIQSFNIQGSSYQIVEQYDRKTPYSRIYTSALSPESLMNKEFTIVNQSYDSYLNYFMWLDMFYYYYEAHDKKIVPSPLIHIFDGNGYETIEINFKNVLFSGIDGLDFNFSNNTIDMKTFSCNFRAQEVEIKLMNI